MILSQIKHSICLPNNYRQSTKIKVLTILPTYQSTSFVLLIFNETSKLYSVIFISKEGKILYEYNFDKGSAVDQLKMMNNSEILLIETKKNQILIINLEKKIIYKFKHEFMYTEAHRSTIQIFWQTKIFCIIEKGNYNESILKLCYYKYPKTIELIKYQQPQSQFYILEPLHQQYFQPPQYKLEFTIVGGDHRSTIIWFSKKCYDFAEFYSFSLQNNPLRKLSQWKISKIEIQSKIKENSSNYYIYRIWQIEKDKFYINYWSILPGNSNYSFIYSVNEDKKVNAFKKLDSLNEELKRLCSYIIDFYPLGTYYVINGYEKKKKYKIPKQQLQDTKNVLSIFLDRKTHKILQISHVNPYEPHYPKYQFVGYDGDEIIQTYTAMTTFDYPSAPTIVKKKFIRMKQLYLNMLQQMFDFDDDLLMDVIEMIEYS